MPLAPPEPHVGVMLLLLSLFCLGTWPAVIDLCCLRGRHPCHVYLDYATSIMVCSLLQALTLGSDLFGASSQPSFTEQLSHPSPLLTLAAACGGAMLMFGNLSMQRALLMEVPLAIVLPLQGSLCVVLGTTINYMLQPELSQPLPLFSGVGAFVLAITLSTSAYLVHAKQRKAAKRRAERARRRRARCAPATEGHTRLEEQRPPPPQSSAPVRLDEQRQPQPQSSAAPVLFTDTSAPVLFPEGNAPLILFPTQSDSTFPVQLEEPASAEDGCCVGEAARGLCIAALGGLAFGFFSPAFNLAVNDQFGWSRGNGGPLTVWTANFYFCFSFSACAWVANLAFMRFGEKRSSLADYASDHKGRALACAAGVICAAGNATQFVGGASAGFATADLVQAFPLVGTVWGIACFGEFKGASRRVVGLLVAMYATYAAAVALLMGSVQATK